MQEIFAPWIDVSEMGIEALFLYQILYHLTVVSQNCLFD